MYLTIDLTDYTEIMNLAFAPQIDLTIDALPINEFSVDVVTDDSIAVGQYAELYDDMDTLWAKYWIIYAERTSEHVVSLRARSELELMEHVTLDGVMYSGTALSDVLDETMVRSAGGGLIAIIDYDLDSSLSSVTVTGYCPEQTARERLQWILFTCGAYCQSYFNAKPTIKPIDVTDTLIPIDRTYWRPTVDHTDYVTEIKVTAYAFTMSTGVAQDDTSYPFPLPWAATETVYTISNSAAPSGIADNVVEITGVYLINASNYAAILSRLAARYFKRTTVDADVIDNAEYIPGDHVSVYAGDGAMYSGYVETATFAFGKQAKATLHLTAAEAVECAELTVIYTSGVIELAREVHMLPVGYVYNITTRYIDIQMNGHRYIYRPTTATISGTVTSSGATAEVVCAVALDYADGVLGIVSVDDLSASGGVVTIE